MRSRIAVASILALLIGGAVTAPSRAEAKAAEFHPCSIHLPSGFPGLQALQARRVDCREARGVARWVWSNIHRQSLAGESQGLPRRVGPVRHRTFTCGYRKVEHGDAILYAARCSAGRSVVEFHLTS